MEAYRAEMEDDNEEFAHLEREDETFMVETTPDRDEEDDEDEEPREMVTTMQLQEELRRVARGEQVRFPFCRVDPLLTRCSDR